MEIYLPIAEVSVNPILVICLGAMVGMMSGIFGVGGGFLMTPILFSLASRLPSRFLLRRPKFWPQASAVAWRTLDGGMLTSKWGYSSLSAA